MELRNAAEGWRHATVLSWGGHGEVSAFRIQSSPKDFGDALVFEAREGVL